jgi:hypothetical protein
MMNFTIDSFFPVTGERSQYYVGTSVEDRPEIQGYRATTRHSPEGYIVPETVGVGDLDSGGAAMIAEQVT